MFQYQLADYSVSWAKHKPVYKHLTKDRWSLWIVVRWFLDDSLFQSHILESSWLVYWVGGWCIEWRLLLLKRLENFWAMARLLEKRGERKHYLCDIHQDPLTYILEFIFVILLLILEDLIAGEGDLRHKPMPKSEFIDLSFLFIEWRFG